MRQILKKNKADATFRGRTRKTTYSVHMHPSVRVVLSSFDFHVPLGGD